MRTTIITGSIRTVTLKCERSSCKRVSVKSNTHLLLLDLLLLKRPVSLILRRRIKDIKMLRASRTDLSRQASLLDPGQQMAWVGTHL